jgi:hypothetical protein
VVVKIKENIYKEPQNKCSKRIVNIQIAQTPSHMVFALNHAISMNRRSGTFHSERHRSPASGRAVSHPHNATVLAF